MSEPAVTRVRPRVASSRREEVLSFALLVISSLAWFVIVLLSVGATAVAAWVVLALARAGEGHGALRAVGLTALVTVFIPLALALWRHRGEPRRALGTLAWLPAVWNVGGLALAAQLIPDLMGTALRSHGASVVVEPLGDSHTGTRVLSALGHNAADWVDPEAEEGERPPQLAVQRPAPSLTAMDMPAALTVPFSSEGNAILIDVNVYGPAGKITVPYLFDTGASFTTINSETAERLGIVVPEDAPTLQFNTASGPRESRMVHLPAIELGDVRIEGLLVSVCDGCVNERSAGLLGLNVMREFFVQMDYQAEVMHLIPRSRDVKPNRAYDINPVVELDVEGRPEIWLGRVRWVVLVKNRSTAVIEDVVPEVQFSDGQRLRGAPIARIEPGESGRSLVEGRAARGKRDAADDGGETLGFTLTIAEARW